MSFRECLLPVNSCSVSEAIFLLNIPPGWNNSCQNLKLGSLHVMGDMKKCL